MSSVIIFVMTFVPLLRKYAPPLIHQGLAAIETNLAPKKNADKPFWAYQRKLLLIFATHHYF
ncbi:hypothetical protein AT1219_100023 [Vibrio alginolyticus]